MLERAHDRGADRDNPTAPAGRATIAVAVVGGISYGSSNGRRASRASSPVDEIPAACVIVANSMPRARSAPSVRQSSANPADGGSNATGGPAIAVQSSQSASGAARARTELDGRVERGRPRSRRARHRIAARQARMTEHVLDDRRRAARAEAIAGAQRRRQRSMFGRRVKVAGAEDHRRRSADIVRRERSSPARRTSIASPVRSWRP